MLNYIKNVSVDLTEIKVIDKENLVPLLEEFCKEKGLQLLQYTYDELFDKGYGNDTKTYLPETILISLSDAVIEKNKICIYAYKYQGNLGSFKATYMLYKKDGVWVVDVSDIKMG